MRWLFRCKRATPPRFVGPDTREVWRKAFPDIPNHTHVDLPAAWRACWTIHNAEGSARELVTVIFLGTHKEYDALYGSATSQADGFRRQDSTVPNNARARIRTWEALSTGS